MRKFKKYEFDSKEQAQTAIDNLGTHDNDVVMIGYAMTTQGTFDKDTELTPSLFSDKYSVDVIWHDKKDKDWRWF